MGKKVKMADIAQVLQVSTVTVSKALSDQKGVSEEMREKIKKLAGEWGYKQPSVIQSIKKMPSYHIGIVVPDKYFGKYDSFYWQMYQAVATKAVQKECFTMLEVISEDDEKNLELPKLMKEKKVNGIILLGRPNTSYIKRLQKESSVPLICLDFYDEAGICDSVISDGYYGTYSLTNHLFEMGHENIAYIGTLLFTNSITDRYFGYCKSMIEHGKEVTRESVIDDRDWETGVVGGMELEFPNPMPTAFVCNSDLSASFLVKSVREKGYLVPEDISVVGFDNYLYPGLCDIGITTYDVDVEEMASQSIDALIKKLSGEAYKKGVRIVEGHLVFKESVQKKNLM